MTLAHLVYRIASDPVFAAQFAKEPHTTLLTSGITLDDHVTSAVLAVLADAERADALCTRDQGIEALEWYSPKTRDIIEH